MRGHPARPLMRYLAAVVNQQGVKVAIVSVDPRTLRSTYEANKVQIAFAPVFPGLPIVLMSQDMMGAPTFHGRKDLVALLSNVPLNTITWREYSYGR